MELSQAIRTSIYEAISGLSIIEKANVRDANILLSGGYSLANLEGSLIVTSGVFTQGESKVIPVFDGVVNPNVDLPQIEKATVYIIINDQQENIAPVQNMCNERIVANITVKVVTKYVTANVTDRTLLEAIAHQVKKAIRPTRVHALQSEEVNIQDVSYPIIRDMDEFAGGQTALSKVLIYSITVNQ